MDSNLKRSIVLEHYQNPINKGLIEDDSYIKISMDSESCIDDIDLMFLIKDGIIKDIRFDGEACAISTSSTSIMISTLIGKSLDEAYLIYDNFTSMIDEKPYEKDILEEAIVYDEIYKQPNRKKCALLPWMGLKQIIDQKK